MRLWLDALPLLAVVALLATGRTSLLRAGLAALALALPGIWLAVPRAEELPARLALEAARGAWIAFPAVAVILAGLVFHQVVQEAASRRPQAVALFSHRRLFAVCFLVGPFAESATGFGIGAFVVLAGLRTLGIAGLPAVALSLLSQVLVPWGALAIGTTVGANIAGVSPDALGYACALLTAPLLLAYAAVFWSLASRAGQPVSPAHKIDDLAWLAGLAVLLAAVSRAAPVELAGLLASGTMVLLRYLRDERPSPRQALEAVRANAPFLLLLAALALTRLIGPLAAALRQAWRLQPFADLPPFAVLHHASVWLLAVAVAWGLGAGASWRSVLRHTWRAGRFATAVTVLFLVLAQWMVGFGGAARLAEGWMRLAGGWAVVASPLFGALAGWLTGSNVSSNAILMPLQAALAGHAGASALWVAALQNTAGSSFTAVSPVRVSMVCALLGLAHRERSAYRLAAPLAGAALLVLEGAALLGAWLAR